MDREPMTKEELESLASKRIQVYLDADRRTFGPAHIAIVHDRIAPLEFSVGVTAFQGIDSIVAPSLNLTYELWGVGKNAARQMYLDHHRNIDEVQLLGTIIVDAESATRHMWLNSPAITETLEVVLHQGKDFHAEADMVPGKKFSFPIECGFELVKRSLATEEYIRWN